MSLMLMFESSQPPPDVGFNSSHDDSFVSYVHTSFYGHWSMSAFLLSICLYLEMRCLIPLGVSFMNVETGE